MSKNEHNLFSLGKFLFEEALLAVLFLWVLPQFNTRLPIWLVIIIMLLYAIYYCITSILIAKLSKSRSIVGIDALINSKCQTVTNLSPDGYVKVGNELWRACSLSGDIGSGNEVEIENVRGLTLIVKISDHNKIVNRT
jgi:membrane-bound ClpP family serine protease